jgi:hypothetical protein
MVETDPKSNAATIADTYPITTLESVILRSINFNPCTHHGYFIDIKTYHIVMIVNNQFSLIIDRQENFIFILDVKLLKCRLSNLHLNNI